MLAIKAVANEETKELRKVIAEQQAILKKLEERLNETEEKLEATADQVEASSSSDSAFANTTIGGYGELHYNNYDSSDPKSIFIVLFYSSVTSLQTMFVFSLNLN